MTDRPRAPERPAYYARRGGRLADFWTLLHPPYTLWHLSYVVIGAAVAERVELVPLLVSVLAFFLAVGVAAHALDERAGRPLGTGFTDRMLDVAAFATLVVASALGLYGAFRSGGPDWALAAAVPVGILLVVGYNLELFGGRLHNDLTFALAWGGFPVIVGFVAQPSAGWSRVPAAAAAACASVALTYSQRRLSTPARDLRRRTEDVTGEVRRIDGTVVPVDVSTLLAPLEGALRALSYAVPLLAVTLLLTHA